MIKQTQTLGADKQMKVKHVYIKFRLRKLFKKNKKKG